MPKRRRLRQVRQVRPRGATSRPRSGAEVRRTPCPKGDGQEELPHVRGQGQLPRVPDCDGTGTAERSYPASEITGEWLRGVTPHPRSGAATRGVTPRPRSGWQPGGDTPCPKPEARGSGREELPHVLKPEAKGGGGEEQPHDRGQGRWPGGPTARPRSRGCTGAGGHRGAIPR